MDDNNITCSICEEICQSEDDFRTHLTQHHNVSELNALVDQSERRTAHLQQDQVEQEAYKILKREKKKTLTGGDKIKVATRLDSTGTKIESVTVTPVAETTTQNPSKSNQKDTTKRPSEVQPAMDKFLPGPTGLTYRWFMGQWQLEPRCAFSKNVLLNEEGTDASIALWLFLQGKGIENTSTTAVISILKNKNLNSVCQVIAGLFLLNFCAHKDENQLREIKEEMNEKNVGSFFVELFSLYEGARLSCNIDGTTSFWVVSSITNKLMSALKTRKNTSKTTVAAIPHYHTICFKYVSSLFEKHTFPVSCLMYVLDSSRTFQNGTISVKICTKYDDIVANIHKAVLDCNGIVDPDLLKEWNLSDINIVEVESLLDLLYSVVTGKEIVLSKGIIVALYRLRAETVLSRLMQNDTICNSKETADFLESHFVKELDVDALAQAVSSNVSADAQFDLISDLSKDNLSRFFLSPKLSLPLKDKWSLLIRWICKQHNIECSDPWKANAEGKGIENLYTDLYNVLQLNNLEESDVELLIRHNFVSFEYGTSDL